MSTGEPDSGTGPTLNNNDPISNNEDTDCDATEKVTATTTNANYDNIDGNTISLKCDRCDNFETQSRALFLVHLTQCGNTNALGLNLLNSVTTNNNNNGETEGDPLPLPVQGDHQQTTKPQNHNRKLFECDVCNMKFSNGANMRRHKMRHTGVKPYECRVCQKRFFRKDHLAEHFTTHTKTLPYHCPICNRGFQRQIAMRAHFQNEHVGQHDLVKTCPLCSFRAGTMKSLRVHFFNRHGIDLDNPGPNAPSSLLLALDPTNASQFLPQMSIAVAAAAAAASGPAYSDSGDSLRSGDNATPPMHFLTPHVEISMADNDNYKNESNPTNSTSSGSLELLQQPSRSLQNGGSPCSPQSADSNSNAPSSSQSLLGNATPSTRNSVADGQITPSISLIPIKQEPVTNDEYSDVKPPTPRSSDQQPTSNVANSSMDTSISPSSSLTSLIKVSPLKSLLREDLKRRICARANNRANRINNSALNAANSTASSASTSSVVMSTDQSSPGVVATTSNGIITSTGAESEPMGGGTSRKNRCLQCLFCGIEFPDQTLYFLHKGCHSESNPWKCNICGEQCNNVYEFNSHLLSKSHQ